MRKLKWPKSTEEELKTRKKALKIAKQVREKLDIRPLKTEDLIRQLRGD